MSLIAGNDVWNFLMQVEAANRAGVHVFAAAGNSNTDAFHTYPCAVPAVDCVAAADAYYKRADFSNYGSSVNYVAPGVDILSLGNRHNLEVVSMSGTSMACPHAVGAAAIFVSVS
jgi:cerevisin